MFLATVKVSCTMSLGMEWGYWMLPALRGTARSASLFDIKSTVIERVGGAAAGIPAELFCIICERTEADMVDDQRYDYARADGSITENSVWNEDERMCWECDGPPEWPYNTDPPEGYGTGIRFFI